MRPPKLLKNGKKGRYHLSQALNSNVNEQLFTSTAVIDNNPIKLVDAKEQEG